MNFGMDSAKKKNVGSAAHVRRELKIYFFGQNSPNLLPKHASNGFRVLQVHSTLRSVPTMVPSGE